MSATIKDITAVLGDPAYDIFAGDTRNATASFIDIDNGNAVIATVPVGLLAGDLLTGTATYNWVTGIGTGDSKQFTIGIRVNKKNLKIFVHLISLIVYLRYKISK